MTAVSDLGDQVYNLVEESWIASARWAYLADQMTEIAGQLAEVSTAAAGAAQQMAARAPATLQTIMAAEDRLLAYRTMIANKQ